MHWSHVLLTYAGMMCYGVLQADRQQNTFLLIRAAAGQQTKELRSSVNAVPLAIGYSKVKGQQHVVVITPGTSCCIPCSAEHDAHDILLARIAVFGVDALVGSMYSLNCRVSCSAPVINGNAVAWIKYLCQR